MKFSTALTLISVLVFSACTTTTELPDGRKLKHKEVCRTLASGKCAPIIGKAKALKNSPQPIVIKDSAAETALLYLGTLIRRDAKVRGERGMVCGGTLETPFTTDDLLVMDIKDIDVRHEAFDQQRSLFSNERLKRDIKQALRESRVTEKTIKKLSTDIYNASSQLRSVKLKTTATFHQYQLKDDVLRQLETAKYSSRFKSCLIDLKTYDWRLYQAITGFTVQEETFDTHIIAAILEPVAERAVALEPSLSKEALLMAMEEAVTYQLNTSVPPYFQLVGVSFWESQRYPHIR